MRGNLVGSSNNKSKPTDENLWSRFVSKLPIVHEDHLTGSPSFFWVHTKIKNSPLPFFFFPPQVNDSGTDFFPLTMIGRSEASSPPDYRGFRSVPFSNSTTTTTQQR